MSERTRHFCHRQLFPWIWYHKWVVNSAEGVVSGQRLVTWDHSWKCVHCGKVTS